jgi:hypothetical protein
VRVTPERTMSQKPSLLYLRLFIVAVSVNFIWEMAQAGLYAPMGAFWQATWRCFVASLGDGGIVMIIALAGSALFTSADWFLTIRWFEYGFGAFAGLFAAVIVEWWGLSSARWAYESTMPLVPGTRLGVVPLAQMTLLVPVSLWLSALWQHRVSRRRGGHRL